MRIKAYRSFQKCYRSLPKRIQKKIDNQVMLLSSNFRHPSLRAKKIRGTEGIWEARVDIHYRMTFEIVKDTIFLRVVGSHKEVLKNL